MRSATSASISSSVRDWRASSSGATSASRPASRGPLQRSARGLGVIVVDHVEDGVEAGKDGENRVAITGEELALVDGRVGGADEVEDGGAGFGGIQVVGQRSQVVGLRLAGGGLQRGVGAGGEIGLLQPLMRMCAGARWRWWPR